jgi:hypothetical protein
VRSIFFLWKLIIQLATLKGGDGDGGGSDNDSSSDDSGGWGTSDDGWGGGYEGPSPDASDYDSGGWDSFGNDGSDSSDNDSSFIDDVVDTVTGWFEDEPSITAETVTEDATYTSTYDPNTGSITTSIMDSYTGAYDVTVTTPDTFGGFQVDNYTTNPDGSMNTSDHISNAGTAYSYSYDQHYYSDTNTPFGITAEMYADISEMLGYEYSESVAKGFEVVGSIVSIGLVALPFFKMGTQMVAFGSAINNTKLTVLGYTSMFAGGYFITNELTELNTIFGGSISVNTSIAMSNDGGASLSVGNLTTQADQELVVEKAIRDTYYADVSTGMIFDKMAGGRLYQSVFAGDIYFDATKGPNTNFSVGESFSLSSHSLITNAPYSEFIPKNQAGTDRFSVVSV